MRVRIVGAEFERDLKALFGLRPLAVVRKQASELPLSINLTDQNVMVPGRKISDKDSLKLVARIALSGSPAATTGDLYSEAVWARGQNGQTAIHIDSTVP